MPLDFRSTRARRVRGQSRVTSPRSSTNADAMSFAWHSHTSERAIARARASDVQERALRDLRRRSRRSRARATTANERASRVDIPLNSIARKQKIGSGSFGDVFEGQVLGKAVVMKERKNTELGAKFFRAEAEVNRRLKGCDAVASFIGVAGADAFLVWKDEGRMTLEDAMGKALARELRCASDEEAARKVAKGVLRCARDLHGRGVIHRDVKPNNVLITFRGELKLIDLGGAADLRTGTNFDEAETVFDPVYGPPERYITGKFGGLFGGLQWGKSKPDLFDAFSCGMVIMQVSCPSMRKKGGMAGVRRELKTWAYDLPMWRASLPDRRQNDFAILDANDGAGWKVVCGLCAQKEERMSVTKALGSPFCK